MRQRFRQNFVSKSAEKPKLQRLHLRSFRKTSSCNSVFNSMSEKQREQFGSSTIFKTALLNSLAGFAMPSSQKLNVSDCSNSDSNSVIGDVSPISMSRLSATCSTPSPEHKKRVMLDNSRGLVRFWNSALKKRDSCLVWFLSSIFRALRIQNRSWCLEFKVKCAVFVLLLLIYAIVNFMMCVFCLTKAILTKQGFNLYCHAVFHSVCALVSVFIITGLLFVPYAKSYHLAFNIFGIMYLAERGFKLWMTNSFAIGIEGTYISLVLLQVILQNPLQYLWILFFFVSMLVFLILSATNYDVLVLNTLAALSPTTYAVERVYSLLFQTLVMTILVIAERRYRHDAAVVEKVSRDIEVLDLNSEIVRRISKKHPILCSNIQLTLKNIVKNMRVYRKYIPEYLYGKEVIDHTLLSHGTSSSPSSLKTPKRGGKKGSSGSSKKTNSPDNKFFDVSYPDTSTLSSDGCSDYVVPANSPTTPSWESPSDDNVHSWGSNNYKDKGKEKSPDFLRNVLDVFISPKRRRIRREIGGKVNSTPPGPDGTPSPTQRTLLLLVDKVVTYMIIEIFEFESVMEMGRSGESGGKISKLLCLYISIIKQCVDKYHGVIDVISGDRVGVSFNAAKICVNHAGNACEAALALGKRFVPLIQGIQLNLKICVCTSQVLCGNVGCSTLKRYTLFGDCVTLAPLLNYSVNHSYSTTKTATQQQQLLLLLIDTATYKRIKFEFRTRIADVVKFKTRNLLVYSVTSHLPQSNEWMYNIQGKELSDSAEWYDLYERAWEDLRKEQFESAERNVEKYMEMKLRKSHNSEEYILDTHDDYDYCDRYLKVLKIRIAEKAVPEIYPTTKCVY